MSIEHSINEALERTISGALADPRIQSLINGRMSSSELRAFVHRFVVTHLSSVQILSFLHSLAPPDAAELVRENLLEEMGLEEAECPHPDLVLDVARGVGFSEQEIARFKLEAADVRRQFASVPLPYRTLREQGLAVLLETLAFESFLSRVSDHVAKSLTHHYGLTADATRWFTLHGEVDIRHAEEGRQVVQHYISFYGFDARALEAILRRVFDRNVVLDRYFPYRPPAPRTRVSASVESVEIMPVQIPFTRRFDHAKRLRSSSDAVIVRVRGTDGSCGYGEGLPRPYVTGEDVDTMVTMLRTELAGEVVGQPFASGEAVLDRLRALAAAWSRDPRPTARVAVWNASRCALELALLDWAFRRAGESLASWLVPARESVIYSGVIDATDPTAAAELARDYVAAGFRKVKVKVGIGDDVQRIEAVRAAVGESVALRVDANGTWTAAEAVAALQALQPSDIEAVEQPVPAADLAGMRRVRVETGIPVVADESLLTMADACRLIDEQACDIFNVRISKCGGLLAAKEIAEAGIAAGLKVQVGAQVGETSLLSAAGRHLAAHLPKVEDVEGSFGTHLLVEDITPLPVMFGYQGRGDLLFAPGLGVDVDADTLARFAVETIRVEQ